MIIGIDNSPLVSSHKLAHKIRGTGYYTKNLIDSLKEYHPEHEYIFFQQGNLPTKKVDIYHYPYFEPFFLSLPFIKNGKTILTVHDLTPIVFPELFPIGLKGKMKYKVQKWLAKRSDAIITDSIASKKDIERLLNISQSQVFSVPLAAASHFKKINISKEERQAFIRKYKIPSEFALYVGDATPNKNLKMLVNSVTKAEIPLVMVGGALADSSIKKSHPWNRDLVYVQDTSKKNPNIFILGFVSDDDLVKLYNIARVFVFPSLYEGFGLPVLEAAACGCPVITTKGGSIPEVIGEAGYYVDPYDEMDIVDKIREIFSNQKLREKLSDACYQQSKKFSWKNTADNTVKVYEKIYKST